MPTLEIKLKPKLIHKLRLTPQIRLSLNLLQLPMVQLKEYLKQEVEKNPLLEFSEDYPTSSAMPQNEEDEEKTQYQKSLITQTPTLQEYLLNQLQLFVKSKKDLEIGEYIIGSINENGYFTDSIEEVSKMLKIDISKVKEILCLIQTFNPIGTGARDLRECLLLQLKAKGEQNSLRWKIVDKYLLLLEKRRYEYISKELGISVEKIKEAIKEIAELEPKPGRNITNEKARYIIPDAVLRKTKQGYEVISNDWELPTITINEKYKKMIKQKNTLEDTKIYLIERLKGAQSLINALAKRKETIQKIIEDIIYIQKDFFDNKKAFFKPMTLSQIAHRIGKHKSTISRAISNKYLQTPHGIFELRYFLDPGIKQQNKKILSSKAIKSKIKDLIINENKEDPLTDQRIVEFLRQEGISVSRRTITKYRKQLKILPSTSRRK